MTVPVVEDALDSPVDLANALNVAVEALSFLYLARRAIAGRAETYRHT
jgi:hypothetical protein